MAGQIFHEWNGTVLTITSDSGTSSCDLKGATGDTGIRGPQGIQGEKGEKGAGEKGDTGAAFTYDMFTPEQLAALTGPEGPTGKTGETGAPFTYDMFTEAQLESLRGPQGVQGKQGIQGEIGPAGKDGVGIPTGGTTGQILTKASAADYDTKWADAASGYAYNLLDNSDFRNPVNQRGATSYTGAGYTIDRWENNSAACKLTVEDGYIHMQNNSGSTSTATQFIRQKIENPSALIGKTITIAARVKGNCRLGCEGIELTYPSYVNCADWTTITLTVDISTMTGDYIAAVLQGPNKSEWYCSWIALYKGSYTAETLPPYVPKGKHVEMLNCGVSLTPHNLLDNSDFTNPVNQRGKTSYSGGYGIDRWKQWSNSYTTTINDNSISISIIQQYIGSNIDFDKTYTVAAKKVDGSILCEIGTFNGKLNKNGLRIDYDANTDGTKKPYIAINEAGDYVWAALYEGSYTAETLPPYVPKGYAAEFAECRRYYKRFTSPNAAIICAGYVTGGTKCIYFNAPDNQPMRIVKPSCTFTGLITVRGINGYIAEDYSGGVFTVYANATGCISMIEITRGDSAAWNATNNTPVFVNFHGDSVFELIADL